MLSCHTCDPSVALDDEGCLGGSWYGYCSSDNCYGLCEYEGQCPCVCHWPSTRELFEQFETRWYVMQLTNRFVPLARWVEHLANPLTYECRFYDELGRYVSSREMRVPPPEWRVPLALQVSLNELTDPGPRVEVYRRVYVEPGEPLRAHFVLDRTEHL